MKIIRNTDKNKSKNRMYGYDLKDNSTTMVSAPLENMPAVTSKLEILSLNIEKDEGGLDKIKIKYNDNGRVMEKERYSCYDRNESELSIDNHLLSTFREVVVKNDVKGIKASDFLDEIGKRLKADVRYGYKRFFIFTKKNSRHSVYIYHVYTIIIATLSILNELDFKLPIRISLDKEENGLVLQIDMKLKSIDSVKTKRELFKKSINEARAIYLEALCHEDELENVFHLNGKRISLKCIIDEVSMDKYKVFSKEQDEDEFFNRFMDIFNGSVNDIAEGEEEA